MTHCISMNQTEFYYRLTTTTSATGTMSPCCWLFCVRSPSPDCGSKAQSTVVAHSHSCWWTSWNCHVPINRNAFPKPLVLCALKCVLYRYKNRPSFDIAATRPQVASISFVQNTLQEITSGGMQESSSSSKGIVVSGVSILVQAHAQ